MVRPIQMLDGGPESFNPLNTHPRDTNITSTPPPQFFANWLPFTLSLTLARKDDDGCKEVAFACEG